MWATNKKNLRGINFSRLELCLDKTDQTSSWEVFDSPCLVLNLCVFLCVSRLRQEPRDFKTLLQNQLFEVRTSFLSHSVLSTQPVIASHDFLPRIFVRRADWTAFPLFKASFDPSFNLEDTKELNWKHSLLVVLLWLLNLCRYSSRDFSTECRFR